MTERKKSDSYEDHSLVEAKQGELNPEEAKVHPNKNIITKHSS